MFEVKVIADFSGAHRLSHYKGKCEDLHGHNWRVEFSAEKDTLDEIGMVVDFTELKRELKAVVGMLDHKYLNDLPFFKDANPTSENIAKFIYDKLHPQLKNHGLKHIKITVWETETSAASYQA